jgi:hypothetical protein
MKVLCFVVECAKDFLFSFVEYIQILVVRCGVIYWIVEAGCGVSSTFLRTLSTVRLIAASVAFPTSSSLSWRFR